MKLIDVLSTTVLLIVTAAIKVGESAYSTHLQHSVSGD